MGIKQLYNDNLRKLSREYGDVSVMHVLITCKFEKDRISSNWEKVVTSIF